MEPHIDFRPPITKQKFFSQNFQSGYAPKVRDDENFDFLVEMMLRVGVLVPLAQDMQAALQHTATTQCLLGDDVEPGVLKVWECVGYSSCIQYHAIAAHGYAWTSMRKRFNRFIAFDV